ncbi:MAG: single-stranded-DNA-specific exonuclease RecJ [Lishizhenia sp.]
MNKKWLLREKPPVAQIENLAKELNVSKIVAQMLIQRGISTFDGAKHFFRSTVEDTHNPFLMLNMKKAVRRVNDALSKNEKILIYGDYDVDGTTAVALVYSFLRRYTNQIEYYIPDRYKEGYGLSLAGIDYANVNGFSLIVTLDCGVKAVEKVAYGKEKGVDFIICDHHTPGTVIPEAIVLDQKQKDCKYPFKELSGCGVGFKLMHALCIENNWDTFPLFESLDLLAISIGADIVSVTGENRILSTNGLHQMNVAPRPGISKMLHLAKRKPPLTLTDVVFTIAPRINAAGRMGDAKDAVKLMLATKTEELEEIGAHIQAANDLRKDTDSYITEQALADLTNEENFEYRKSTVLYKEDWHKGVIGIVASRLIEKYYRPTIVLTASNETIAAGSVRSVKGFDVYSALEKCSDVLLQFGGHKYAAGLTIEKSKISALKEKFEEVVAATISDEELVPEEIVEMELSFSDIFNPGESIKEVPRLKRILKQFEPHGPENMKPVFLTRNVFARDGFRLLKELHLKCTLYEPESNIAIEAIGFSMPEKYEILASGLPFDVIYTLETNTWKERTTLQLNIKDIRSAV